MSDVPRHLVRNLTLVALVAIAVFNVGDVITTHMLLNRRAIEANPLASTLVGSGVLLWVKLALVFLALLITLRLRPRMGLLVFAWFVAGIYATAVLSNALILRIT